MRERERERESERERERESMRAWTVGRSREGQIDFMLSPEPYTGLHLTTLRSWPEPKSKVRILIDWATQVPPVLSSYSASLRPGPVWTSTILNALESPSSGFLSWFIDQEPKGLCPSRVPFQSSTFPFQVFVVPEFSAQMTHLPNHLKTKAHVRVFGTLSVPLETWQSRPLLPYLPPSSHPAPYLWTLQPIYWSSVHTNPSKREKKIPQAKEWQMPVDWSAFG